ncbi:MAG: 3-phosphoshikimate 1-carboxyvinyltransferase [Candidatus Omnitrophica bacterium]|nr:3-phosphoshikimate 1-carboxyvinyltransferase [Candidatus Omnitrophota bacterium]
MSLKGEVCLPGDKSIAHRAIILGALAQGKTTIENFPLNKDCNFTMQAFKKLGVKITVKKNIVNVFGRGLSGLRKPDGDIFVGDSGTTFRLLLGVLAGQGFTAKLVADRALSKRPMLRITAPLRLMGADISARRRITKYGRRDEYPPVTIKGGSLKAITYKLPVASAQVKSAILLAGLLAKGKTKVIEPVKTRDHSERMLRLFKADIRVSKNTITIKGGKKLTSPGNIYVPGDISSAAFFMVAAAIIPGSRVVIKKVSLNPSRLGIIKVLGRMSADIKIKTYTVRRNPKAEPYGDIIVKASNLKATLVTRNEIPSLIDELPILMVAAALAKGRTTFQGVGELRVKETDRIKSMTENLQKMGAEIKIERKGNFENVIVKGSASLKGNSVKSYGDHRTAMSMAIAGLRAEGKTKIDNVSCVGKSFPDFFRILNSLKW